MKVIKREQVSASYSADNLPLLHVKIGETFFVETLDRMAAFSGPETAGVLKSVTGPIFVEKVRPGDTIKVEFLDIKLPLAHGWILTTGRGPLKDRVPDMQKRRVELSDRGVLFNKDITLPLRPMVSRVGVAPATGSMASVSNGVFGGAMGNPMVTKGASIYLPVFHDGALLHIGDGHAAHGEGEVAATAVECAVDVTLRITLEDRFSVKRPMVTTPDQVLTTGDGETIEDAIRVAVQEMSEFLADRLGITEAESAMIIGASGDLKFGLAGYPPYAVSLAMPTSVLPI